MPIIRCTHKLLREMGLKAADLSTEEPDSSPLSSWHANLIYIARRKCILFTNDRTLFNFIAPDMRRVDIRNLGKIFLSYLPCVLNEEQLPRTVVEQIMSESAHITYGRTSNRSILGSMNDLAFHYKLHILNVGGVCSAEVPSIIKQLNHMPMGALKYAFPIEELKVLYGIQRKCLQRMSISRKEKKPNTYEASLCQRVSRSPDRE